LIFKA